MVFLALDEGGGAFELEELGVLYSKFEFVSGPEFCCDGTKTALEGFKADEFLEKSGVSGTNDDSVLFPVKVAMPDLTRLVEMVVRKGILELPEASVVGAPGGQFVDTGGGVVMV